MTRVNRLKPGGSDYDIGSLHEALLAWFAQHARDLPWRRTRDPYRILVAEVMLQQTQVDRVLPKYATFLERFPTLEALAAAPAGEVIRAWAGLGYNRRAVNLQRAARAVLEEHGGVFPSELDELRRLPGVGPYTAGALACFAFEQDVAFMDTNIRRVVRRVFASPDTELSDAWLLELAQAALPPGRGWAWNQALMELGALVCTATAPACWRCPLRAHCRDYAARRAEDERALEALAPDPPRSARRVAERREEPFVGSSRWYRGRVVAALRELPAGASLPLAALGPRLKPDYAPEDSPWLRALAEALARDGLITLDGEAVRLPD
ncbi:MAG TPA: A/G-specific adenine glycosylase [Roseiflexaceae bacterium]|nr:A/G-specific adenine glycosylase [Roseiflexaceae bacterium]